MTLASCLDEIAAGCVWLADEIVARKKASLINCVTRIRDMKLASLLTAFILSGVVGTPATSATVKVTFSGLIDYTQGFDSTPITLGQAISISHIIDTDATALGGDQSSVVYPFQGSTLELPDLGQSVTFDAALAPSPFFNTISAYSSSTIGYQYQIGTLDSGNVLVGSVVNFPIGQTIDNSTLNPFIDLLSSGGTAGLSKTNTSSLQANFVGTGWWGDCSTAQFGCDVLSRIQTVTVAEVQAVPVPATLPLMGIGLLGLGAFGRRRRN